MNQEKIGNFINLLRKKKGLSQKELSAKIGVSRQAISNWELGKVIPDNNSIKKLSVIFGVSVEELLAGEYSSKIKNKKRNLLIFILIIFIIIIMGITFYLFNLNRSENYVVTADSNIISVNNGIIVLKKNEVYFYLGKVTSKVDKEISSIDLFYKINENENIIYSCKNCISYEIVLKDNINKNTYFDVKNIKSIINNLYIKVTFKDKNYSIIKLNIGQSGQNLDKINQKNDSLNNQNSIMSNENIMKLVITKFKKQDDGYVYKTNRGGKSVVIMYMDNNLSIDIIDNNIEETLNYNMLSNYIFYEKCVNQKNIDNQVINTKENNLSNSIVKQLNEILENI